MKKYNAIPTLCVIGGDGIGPEVTEEALRVLDATKMKYRRIDAEAGFSAYEKHGTPLPEVTISTCRSVDAILFGAVTSPPNIKGYFSPIVRLRKLLDLYANVRPFRTLPVAGMTEGVDMILVRENTEDLYAGNERETPEGVVAERIITRKACRRIVTYAFEFARRSGRKHVTAIHKANVLRLSDGLFLQQAKEVASRYPNIPFDDMLVDACAMQLVRKPQEFDVLVTTNMFGDILSDEAAGLVGGLGLAASANIGDTHALFEPVHGSAPKYKSKDRANPTAAILALVMMLEYLEKQDYADTIREAIVTTIAKGKRTADLGGTTTMTNFTDAVIKEIRKTGK